MLTLVVFIACGKVLRECFVRPPLAVHLAALLGNYALWYWPAGRKAALRNLLSSALIAGCFFSSLFFKWPLAEKAALMLLLNLFVCPSAACFQKTSEHNCLLCWTPPLDFEFRKTTHDLVFFFPPLAKLTRGTCTLPTLLLRMFTWQHPGPDFCSNLFVLC